MINAIIQEEEWTWKQKFKKLSARTALEVQDAIIGTWAHDPALSTARGNIQVKSDALSEDGEGIFEVTSYGDATPFEVVIKTIPPQGEGGKEKKEYKVYIWAWRKFSKYSGETLIDHEIQQIVKLGNFLNQAKRLAKKNLSTSNANEEPFYVDHENLVMKGGDKTRFSTEPFLWDLTPQRIYKRTLGKNKLPLNLWKTYKSYYDFNSTFTHVTDYLNQRRKEYQISARKVALQIEEVPIEKTE